MSAGDGFSVKKLKLGDDAKVRRTLSSLAIKEPEETSRSGLYPEGFEGFD
jgi:hypothetical protein